MAVMQSSPTELQETEWMQSTTVTTFFLRIFCSSSYTKANSGTPLFPFDYYTQARARRFA